MSAPEASEVARTSKPADSRMPMTRSAASRALGPSVGRSPSSGAMWRCCRSTRRSARAISASCSRQSASGGRCASKSSATSPMTTSRMRSMSSSLLRTCQYSEVAPASSSWPSRRIENASMPPSSMRRMAVATISSRVSGARSGGAVSWTRAQVSVALAAFRASLAIGVELLRHSSRPIRVRSSRTVYLTLEHCTSHTVDHRLEQCTSPASTSLGLASTERNRTRHDPLPDPRPPLVDPRRAHPRVVRRDARQHDPQHRAADAGGGPRRVRSRAAVDRQRLRPRVRRPAARRGRPVRPVRPAQDARHRPVAVRPRLGARAARR